MKESFLYFSPFPPKLLPGFGIQVCERGPKKPCHLFIKNCSYSYMFKFQSPSKYSPFDAMHLLRYFFHCSKQFLNMSVFMVFSASAICCFTSSTSAKHFPFRTIFTPGNKKSHSRQDQVNREGGTQGSCHF